MYLGKRHGNMDEIQREIDKNELNPDWNEPGKTMFHQDSSLWMTG
jgi:hypothetical protein